MLSVWIQSLSSNMKIIKTKKQANEILHIIFSIIILYSCVRGTIKNQFSGNWYSCGKDGTYYELLIQGNLFKYSTNKGLITEWYNFKITGDTLSYEDLYILADSVITIISIIHFNNVNEMRLEYLTSNEQWTFYRIQEKITDIENDEKLKT